MTPALLPRLRLLSWLVIAQWRERPGGLVVASLSIAVGIALALGIHLVNRSALAQFASHSEFTAMRAAGLGRRRALATIAGVGLWLALLTAVVGEGLTPVAEKLSQRVRLAALGGTVGG